MECDRIFEAIRGVDGENVTRTESPVSKAGGRASNHPGELPVGQSATAHPIDQRRLGSQSLRMAENVWRKGDIRDCDFRVRTADNHEPLPSVVRKLPRLLTCGGS